MLPDIRYALRGFVARTDARRQRKQAQFLERVNRLNHDDRFLGKVTRVILFGSYLNPEASKLGDVDVGVELQPKESDRKRLLDYKTENEFVDQVPHKVLFSAPQERSKPAKEPSKEIRRTRRPKGCPPSDQSLTA
jgi:predicted nucleotidyltransferase